MAEPFPISGSIDSRAFPFLLMDLHRNGATGSLKVEGPSYQKALYFRGGRILFGSSNDPRDQLGAILIESGKITPEQLEEVNTKVGPGSPLAKVLAETGFVNQKELSDSARAKVERILSDVIAYSSGTFEFEDGVLPKGAVDLKLSTERLVMSAVRRVADPEFVARHLGGIDTVLAPTPELAGGSPELRAEAGDLVDHIDGRRTLRDAASAAHVAEDEAARIACGLLFLGVAERVKGATQVVPVYAPAGDELDLGQTAAMAFSVPEPSTVPMGPALATPEPDEPFFIPDVPAVGAPATGIRPVPALDGAVAAASNETGFEMSSTQAVEPTGFDIAAEPTLGFVPPPAGEPTVLDQTTPLVQAEVAGSATGFEMVAPEPFVPAAVAPEPPPAPARVLATPAAPVHAAPVLVSPAPVVAMPEARPAARHAPALVTAPARDRERPQHAAMGQAAMATPLAPRPSKEDLAALDALLNTAPPEGPMEPMEASPTVVERWETPARPEARSYEPARSYARSVSRTPLVVAIGATAAAALALAALGWRYFTAPRPPRPVARASAPATPRPLPPRPSPSADLAAAVSPAPAASAVVPPPSGAPPLSPPAAAPTSAPLRVATPEPGPATPAPGGDLGSARRLLQDGRFSEAAGGFAANLKRAPAGTTSVQLLVACSTDTIQKAVQNVSSAELFIVPVNFKGRDCYRICWGLYESEARAASATRSVPEYFRRGGAAPRVVSASEILP